MLPGKRFLRLQINLLLQYLLKVLFLSLSLFLFVFSGRAKALQQEFGLFSEKHATLNPVTL